MNKTDCKFERLSNVTVGFLLLIIGIFFTLIGIMIIPFIGLLIAIPVLIIAVVFLASPRSKACAIIAQKTRGAQRVILTHRHATEMVRWLHERGYEAEAIPTTFADGAEINEDEA